MELNVKGDVRIKRRRLRTLKRILSRSGFTRFRCHSVVYLREREREKERERERENTSQPEKERKDITYA